MVAIRPHNWHQLQHYKLRSPPWVKLHRKLLDDIKWHALPVASKALAPMLWLLASEDKEGIIMGDDVEISFRLRMSRADLEAALKPLMDNGMFEDASIVLAGRLQHACSESETETETERERDASAALAPSRARGLAEKPKMPPAGDAMWRERLDGYRPWLSQRVWKPFWGPRPDASGTPNPMIPTAMLAAWKQEANKTEQKTA